MNELRTNQINTPDGQLPNPIQNPKHDHGKRSVKSMKMQRYKNRDASYACNQHTNQNASDANPSQLSIPLKAKLLKLGVCNHALNAAGN